MKIQSPADAARLIKTQRLRRELTQSDVAEAIGVTRQSYARIEQAHGGASFATYLKIFAFLGIVLEGEVSQTGASVDADDMRGSEAGATIPATFPRDRLYGLGQEAAQAALERLRSSGVLARAVEQHGESAGE